MNYCPNTILLFWATRHGGTDFYNEACNAYNDLMSTYSTEIMQFIIHRHTFVLEKCSFEIFSN